MFNSPQYAVQVGKSVDRAMEGGFLAFPFMYTFVNRLQDQWDQIKGSSWYGNLQDIGPLVAANSNTQITVLLDPDHFFKLLYIKYTAYTHNSSYVWHYPVSDPNWFLDPDTPLAMSNSIMRGIAINVSVSHNARYIYGQQNSYSQTASLRPTLPVMPLALQGNEYGWGQVRTPYLLPQNGALRFEIYNDNAVDVVVGAMIYGMKVRL